MFRLAENMNLQTGVSYFSSRALRHVRADLADMVEHHCTYVVHCFTETDLAYYADTMREIVQATHEAGLEAWLDPWGVAGVFSGETFSRFPQEHPDAWQVLSDGRRVPAACPNHPATRLFLRQWVESAATTGADILFWDEPHFYFGLTAGDLSGAWGCRCQVCEQAFADRFGHPIPAEFTDEVCAFREASLLDLLSQVCRQGREKGLANALCLIPTGHRKMGFPQVEERFARLVTGAGQPESALAAMLSFGIDDWQAAAAIADLDIFGCDPYWYLFGTDAEPFMRAYGQRAAEAAQRYGRALQLWVQAFRVPEGREEELKVGLRAAAEVGATHLAAWSYEGTASMSYVRCARPEVVWRILGEAFGELREGRQPA
jgi:hypothetical protein